MLFIVYGCLEVSKYIRPKITTEELANLSGKTSKTIKSHIAKMPHIKYVGGGYSGHWEITDSSDSLK